MRLAGVEDQALVVVVDSDGEDLLGVLLADHVVVECLLDLGGLDETDRRAVVGGRRLDLTVDDRLADVDTRVADVGPAMIFFTSVCDLPQNEHRVMREDLAMADAESGGGLHGESLRLARGGDNVVDDAVGLGLLRVHVIVAV